MLYLECKVPVFASLCCLLHGASHESLAHLVELCADGGALLELEAVVDYQATLARRKNATVGGTAAATGAQVAGVALEATGGA